MSSEERAVGMTEENRKRQEQQTESKPTYTVVQGQEAKPESEESKRLRENFLYIFPAAVLYAVFYAFCMHRNASGVTFPFFVGGSLLFLCFSLSRLQITLKKGSGFYMAAMALLGISTFCTDDARLIFFNKLGVFLLIMSLLLKQFCDVEKWGLGKFLGSIGTLTFASLSEWGRPIADGKWFKQNNAGKVDKRVWQFLLGLLIGVPLVGIVVLMLAGADAVFRQMTDEAFGGLDGGGIFQVLLRITLMFFASYAFLSYLSKKLIKDNVTDKRVGEPVLAITVTSMLTVLYMLFSGIQIFGLFLGKLQLPEGYTYAMYAREGFFQLLAVSFLNLVIVLVCMSYFKESKVLKIILTLMSACTFVMIASSAMRMIMYIRYYYLTFLRILVLWGLLLLAVLFVGVVVGIFKKDFHMFRYGMVTVTVLYLALSFVHPDYLIAKVNVANAEIGSEVSSLVENDDTEGSGKAMENGWSDSFFLAEKPYDDYVYLRELSADAAPVLVPYLERLGYDLKAFTETNVLIYAEETGVLGNSWEVDGFGYYWLRDLQKSTEEMGIRSFNMSRWLAVKAID